MKFLPYSILKNKYIFQAAAGIFRISLFIFLILRTRVSADTGLDDLLSEFESSKPATVSSNASPGSDVPRRRGPEFSASIETGGFLPFNIFDGKRELFWPGRGPYTGIQAALYHTGKFFSWQCEIIPAWQRREIFNRKKQYFETNTFTCVYGGQFTAAPGDIWVHLGSSARYIRAGTQTYAWGTADKNNPSDNINGRDYRIGLRNEKIPLLSVSSKIWIHKNISAEAVYGPFGASDQLPRDIAEEIPDEIFNTYRITNLTLGLNNLYATNITTYNKDNITKSAVVEEVPGARAITYRYHDFDSRNYSLGGRISAFLKQADISVSYLTEKDHAWTPVIILTKKPITMSRAVYSNAVDRAVDAVPDADLFPIPKSMVKESFYTNDIPEENAYLPKEIIFVRKRIHRFSLDGRTEAEPAGLWFEACWSQTGDSTCTSLTERNSLLAWTVGADIHPDKNDTMYINAEYFGKYIPQLYTRLHTDYPSGEPLSNMVTNEAYMQRYFNRALVDASGGHTETLLHGISIRFSAGLRRDTVKPALNVVLLKPYGYDTRERIRPGALILLPELSWKVRDGLELMLFANLAWEAERKAGNLKMKNWSDGQIGWFTADNALGLKAVYKIKRY